MSGYMLSLTIVLELVTMEHLFLPRLYFAFEPGGRATHINE